MFKEQGGIDTNRIKVMALVGDRQPRLELLGNGTHRLITAALLGLPRVPVTLQVHRYDAR